MMAIRAAAAASVLMPSGAQPARLIVCESTGRWAVALRRELGSAADCLFQTRSLADAMAALDAAPASFLLVELHARYAESLAWLLADVGRRYPLCRTGVVADRALARYGDWMLEAGAAAFALGVRRLGPLADAARRHLAAAPQPPQGLVEQVWAELPWRRGAAE